MKKRRVNETAEEEYDDAGAGDGGAKPPSSSSGLAARTDASPSTGKTTTSYNNKKKEEPPTKPPTKRSLLKQPNLKNVWPQQPKVQDSDRRAAAYLRTAGLLSTPKDEIEEEVRPDDREMRFGRLLGGPDQRSRHMALVQLRRYLKAKCAIVRPSNKSDSEDEDDNDDGSSSSAGISELELLKLCKALWYTLYMADKAVVQDELSLRIAKLLGCFVGTPQEDEYAGDCYYVMNQDSNSSDDDSSDDEDGSDDDEDVVMEEVVNTLRHGHDCDCCDEASAEEEEDSMSGPEQEAVAAAAWGAEFDEEEDDDDVSTPDEASDEGDDDEEVGEEDDGTDPRLVLHCRGAHLASLFVRCLLRTVRREWDRMDKYRVDKFYTLIRHVVHQVFQYMSDRKYHPGIVQLFNDALFEEVLRETPNGIRYHLIDVVVDELCAVQHENFNKTNEPFTADDFILVLEPYFALAQHGCGDDTVHTRAVENVLLRFLDRYSVVREDSTNNEGDDINKSSSSSPLFRHVHVGTVADFIFDIAGDVNTAKESYRKALHDTFKAYSRRIKRGTDVDTTELLLQQGEDQDEDDNHASDDEAEKDADVEVPVKATIVSKPVKGGSKTPETTSPPEATKTLPADGTGELKKSKKKKKKKSKPSDDDVSPQQGARDDEDHMQALNRSLRDGDPWWTESAEIEVEPFGKPSKGQKMDKGKQKKSKAAGASLSPTSSNGTARVITEEELLITVQAQRAAKKAAQEAEALLRRKQEEAESTVSSIFGKGKAKKRSKRSEDDSDGDGDKKKRVKIGEHFNRARSYSASMQGLRHLDPKAARAKSPTPERGILLNKDARIVKRAETKPAKRRRAVDYFY